MSSKCDKPISINLNIGDQLTTISCGHIIVEMLKFIAFQRLQIPYSYQWLKQLINKRKMCEEQKNETLLSERHYRVASSAVENLDFLIKSLLQEISNGSMPEEVCISLGASPISSKEVYRILLPTTCHKPQCHSPHIASDQKIHMSVFRELVTSEKLSKVFFNPLPPTSTYVFIKKRITTQEDVLNPDNFTITSGHRIPRSSKIIIIDFRTQTRQNVSCCSDYQVFGDVDEELVNLKIDDSNDCDNYQEIESTETAKWYQSTYVIKGFKDCIVNGTSITNTWFES